MASDPDVTILRVKSRLGPEFDANQSAGFRNLALNLRMTTPAAAALGAETHVCEVQLLLVDMAVIKVRADCPPSPLVIGGLAL